MYFRKEVATFENSRGEERDAKKKKKKEATVAGVEAG